ncbi:hypothetical protein [Geitlerinema sp. PCC 9228]|uniref:hypothetical protein n=1 Tax=Geitlerinema sp. PCC 9228 TaxID=111611 RepID=UPI00147BB118|nr:hypothetical protein [Geitlerinema sp. PCC 9228]
MRLLLWKIPGNSAKFGLQAVSGCSSRAAENLFYHFCDRFLGLSSGDRENADK